MKKQKIIIILLMIIAVLFILMPYSNAALQSNGSAGTTQSLPNWLVNIRKMEALNGGMGLTETIGEDLTPTTNSNNLDVHMEKNTEYGAMAILSASSYGNPNAIASGETTTGNKTGIVINLNKEWVAAGLLNGYAQFVNANQKYKNEYEGTDTSKDGYMHYFSYTAKVGDAISETQGWHGSNSSVWFCANRTATGSNEGLLRAYSGSIFSYYGKSLEFGGKKEDAHYSQLWHSRAAMVCGKGI